MKHNFCMNTLAVGVAAVQLGLTNATFAQSTSETKTIALEEVVVTARRVDELMQDVPMTVNALQGQTMENLIITDLEDITQLVPGLILEENGVGPTASIRGVRYDGIVSGNNGTIEFYLNDSPISALAAIQAMYDIEQVEVLRGPQGTLRGKSSPSGSITLTTRRADLNNFGGYVDLIASDLDERSVKGALNVPLVKEMLGVRLAGVWEESDGNYVESIGGSSSSREVDGYRVSLNFEPTETLAVAAMYQKLNRDAEVYRAVESANITDSSLPPSPIEIKAKDRKSVADFPFREDQEFERINLEVDWEFAGQVLNYVGSKTDVELYNRDATDEGDFIDKSLDFPLEQLDYGRITNTVQKSESQELRLQSADPLFGMVDYVVGYLYKKDDPLSDLESKTNIYLGPLDPGNHLVTIITPIVTGGGAVEKSLFGNLKFSLGENTELTVGARKIRYEDSRILSIGPDTVVDTDSKSDEVIYSFSLAQHFTDSIMGYFTYGSSWRPGLRVVGDFSENPSPLENSFLYIDPETSDSYELGLKSEWLDGQLRVNATVFHQEFTNYPYQSSGTYFVNYGPGNVPSVESFGFVGPVPVEVNGVELEADYQATESWYLGGLFSYAKGEIQDGAIPCNDYFPRDGVPDTAGGVPTVDQILTATGGEHLSSCDVNFRSNDAPLWSANLNSEYRFSLGGMDSYVRGVWEFFGPSENSPTNPVDDVSSYNILSLYTGIRDPHGAWEVSLFAKNVLDTVEVIERDENPITFSYRNPASVTVVTDYRLVALTDPREFGVQLKYNFGLK